MCESERAALSHLFHRGVLAVKGDEAVRSSLEEERIETPTKILAAGKAALAMFRGLPSEWQSGIPTLLVTKKDHVGDAELGQNVQAIEAAHPVPDEASLRAGGHAVTFIQSCNSGDRLLLLLSGGASSLVERLKKGVAFSELVALTREALGEGANIAEINRRRKDISTLKGGKLLEGFCGARVDVLAISDVCGDDINVIGSGLGSKPSVARFDYSSRIVASNSIARSAVVRDAMAQGYKVVINAETMYADVGEVAARIARDVDTGPEGLYLYGGEPTVVLPKSPGLGGRNQALALELARYFRKRTDVIGLVAGTDGTDGPTEAAGAFLDGDTFCNPVDAGEALRAANSAPYLSKIGDQIVTGPTGTNVMDLAIILKHA